MPRPVRRPHGFTLVEVLVALLVLSLMASMAWRGVDALIRTREVAQSRMESLLRAQSVLAQWETDLQAVVSTQTSPGVLCEGGTFHLTRRHPDGVQVVAWSLRGGQLSRWSAPPTTRAEALQEAWMQSFQLLGNEAPQLRALSGVAQWQVYFYAGTAWSNCGSSTGTPNTASTVTAKQALPDGVRLVLTFAEGGTLSGTVTRDISLTP